MEGYDQAFRHARVRRERAGIVSGSGDSHHHGVAVALAPKSADAVPRSAAERAQRQYERHRAVGPRLAVRQIDEMRRQPRERVADPLLSGGCAHPLLHRFLNFTRRVERGKRRVPDS